MVNQELTFLANQFLKAQLDANISAEASKDLKDFRSEGWKNFSLPTKKDEDWHYSPLKVFETQEIKGIKGKAFEETFIPAGTRDAIEIVFVNGYFSEKQSRLSGLYPDIHVSTIDEAIKNGRLGPESGEKWFRALNQAFYENGIYIEIGKEVNLTRPIILRHVVNLKSKAFMASPRVYFRVLPFSKAEVIEIFEDGSAGDYYINDVCDFEIYANSHVHHLRILNESPVAIHTGHVRASLYRDSKLNSTTIATGSKFLRTQIEAFLFEPGATAILNGLALLNDERKSELNVLVHHGAAHTTSNQDFKSILNGKSHGIFNGKIKIEKDAQKSEAHQLSKNLLMSAKAHVDTKPQLDVHADDVKATHGATVGQLDPEELFYLQTRCFSPQDALNIMCRGFAMDVVKKIESPWIQGNVKNWIEGSISSYLGES